MNDDRTSENAARRFGQWVREAALPLWSTAGADPLYGFVERLGFDGEAAPTGYLRCRLLARQIAVFAQASRCFGNEQYAVAADHGWQVLKARFWMPGLGWRDRVLLGQASGEPVLNLYDQAFALYASAWRASVFADEEALSLALATLECIDSHLRLSGGRGWVTTAGDDLRDQNGHMHYLEALLELYSLRPLDEVAERIDEILDVLDRHLVDPASGAVTEYFGSNWRTVDPATVEPGHQYEWAWLLDRAKSAGFAFESSPDRMRDFADRYGWDRERGLIYDSLSVAGGVVGGGFRLWPHCEALKAMSISKRPEDTDRIAALVDSLFTHFLQPEDSGLWTDRRDSALVPLVDYVPTSSLYHLWEAYRALSKRWPDP